MGRWARGDELACGGKPAMSGGCRNLAEWKIISDTWRTSDGSAARTWVICNLHRDSMLRTLKRNRAVYDPVVEPFQDAAAPVSRKRRAAAG